MNVDCNGNEVRWVPKMEQRKLSLLIIKGSYCLKFDTIPHTMILVDIPVAGLFRAIENPIELYKFSNNCVTSSLSEVRFGPSRSGPVISGPEPDLHWTGSTSPFRTPPQMSI